MNDSHHACHVAAPEPAAAIPNDEPTNDPRTIRVTLEARETQRETGSGITVSGYGYNGQVPGPVIEAKQGVPLEITFTNRLSEPTLIHWHGLQIPAPWTERRRRSGRSRRARRSSTASRRPMPARSGITRTPTRPSSSRRDSTARSSSEATTS